MKIKCKKCNHEWETKSKLWRVTCPSCQSKVKQPTQGTCGNCDSFVNPPDEYRGRADRGACRKYNELVEEKNRCSEWEPIPEED